MPRVGEVELAKALNRTRMAIRVAVKTGRLTQAADKTFDLDEAIAEFNANTQHAKGHNNRSGKAQPAQFSGALPALPAPDLPLPGGKTTYTEARAGTQIYQGLLMKLNYERKAGALTPTADVEQARFSEFRTLREACFNIPSRIAALLATETDVAKCQAILEDELVKVFTAFADGIAA
jgi:hypothetical protein